MLSLVTTDPVVLEKISKRIFTYLPLSTLEKRVYFFFKTEVKLVYTLELSRWFFQKLAIYFYYFDFYLSLKNRDICLTRLNYITKYDFCQKPSSS